MYFIHVICLVVSSQANAIGALPSNNSEHTVCGLFTNIKCTIILKFYMHVCWQDSFYTDKKRKGNSEQSGCTVTVRID